MRVRLQTLGVLRLIRSGQPATSQSKPLLVLAALATAPDDGWVSRERLSVMLWPRKARRSRLGSLRSALSTVRALVGSDTLETDGDRVRLRSGAIAVDLIELHSALEGGDIEDAVRLFEGPFLGDVQSPGAEFDAWRDRVQMRVEGEFDSTLSFGTSRAIRDGDPARAERYARSWIALRPWAESAHLALCTSLVDQGRPREAIGAFEEAKARLTEYEVGVSSEFSGWAEEQRSALAAVPRPGVAGPGTPQGSRPGRPATEGMTRGVAAHPTPTAERRRPVRSWSLVTLAVVAGIIALAASLRPKADPIVARAWVGEQLVDIRIGPDEPALETVREEPAASLNRDGTLVAYVEISSDGTDVVVASTDDGTVRHRFDTPADEATLSWSPSGDQLAISRHRAAGGEFLERAVDVFDLRSRSTRALPQRLAVSSMPRAHWSPDGSRLLTYGGGDRPRIFTASGSLLTEFPLEEGIGAWSPDGLRVALGKLDQRGIEVVNVTTSAVEARAMTSVDVKSLMWLTSEHLLLSGRVGDEPRIELLRSDGSLSSVLPGRLPSPAHFEASSAAATTTISSAERHLAEATSLQNGVERVEIVLPPGPVGIGQRFVPRAMLWDGSGRLASTPPIDIEWSVDGDILSLDEDGQVVARRMGRGALRAVYPGTPEASMTLQVHEFEPRTSRLLFSEDWQDLGAWRQVGDPSPKLSVHGLPDGRPGLDPNGDRNFPSGVVSERSFALRGGITVEAELHAPVTGGVHQEFALALPSTAMDTATLSERVAIGAYRIGMVGVANSWEHRDVRLRIDEVAPQCARICQVVLQVGPDGVVRHLIDGKSVAVRKMPAVDSDPRVRVQIVGRSVGGPVLVGRVRVFEGLRYQPVGQFR